MALASGSGIRHTNQLQEGLNFSVFPIFAVETEKHAVGQGADFRNAFPQMSAALILPAFPNAFQIRFGLFYRHIPAESVRFPERLFERFVIFFHPEE